MLKKRLHSRTMGLMCLPIIVSACAVPNSLQDLEWKTVLDGGCAAGASAASAPIVSNGVVYVGSGDGAVYALGASNGEQEWSFQTGVGRSSGTEIVIASRGSDAAEMSGSDPEQPAGNASGKRQITATPAMRDGTIYIGSWDHSFYALDALTGELKWAFDAGLPIMEEAIVLAGRVIFVTGGRRSRNDKGDGLVHALDTSTGKSAWIFDTLPDVEAGEKWPGNLPVVKGGVAYVTN